MRGGKRRLKVVAQRSMKNGIFPDSARRINEAVIKNAEIMMNESTPMGEPIVQA